MNTSIAIVLAAAVISYAALLPVLTPIVSLAVTFLAKLLIPRIPGVLLPLVSGVVGVLTTVVSNAATGTDQDALIGFGLGLGGTALHQIKVQLGKIDEAPKL